MLRPQFLYNNLSLRLFCIPENSSIIYQIITDVISLKSTRRWWDSESASILVKIFWRHKTDSTSSPSSESWGGDQWMMQNKAAQVTPPYNNHCPSCNKAKWWAKEYHYQRIITPKLRIFLELTNIALERKENIVYILIPDKYCISL